MLQSLLRRSCFLLYLRPNFFLQLLKLLAILLQNLPCRALFQQ